MIARADDLEDVPPLPVAEALDDELLYILTPAIHSLFHCLY
jgi:hypothetical protein